MVEKLFQASISSGQPQVTSDYELAFKYVFDAPRAVVKFLDRDIDTVGDADEQIIEGDVLGIASMTAMLVTEIITARQDQWVVAVIVQRARRTAMKDDRVIQKRSMFAFAVF